MSTHEKTRTCPTCGERMEPDAPPHPTVARVVRPGHRWGFNGPGAGQVVQIEERHLPDPSVAKATMLPEEWRAIEAQRQAPKEPKRGRLVEMVERGIAAARVEVQGAIERGRQAVLRNVDRTSEEAAARLGTGPDLPSRDGEVLRDARPVPPAFVPPRALQER